MNAPNIIFVVGASRSGTTLLASILGRAPTIHDAGECHYFGDLCPLSSLFQTPPPERARTIASQLHARTRTPIWEANPTAEDLEASAALRFTGQTSYRDIFEMVLANLATANQKSAIVDQTPRNVYYLEQLLSAYPSARAVEMVRDPRSVLYSQKQRWRIRQLGATGIPRREAIRNYVNSHTITVSKLWNAAVTAGQRLRNHPRVHRIHYEELIHEPEATVSRMCSFFDVPFSREMLAVPRTSSSTSMNTASNIGISNATELVWQRKLGAGDRWLCERITSSTARQVGYEFAPTAVPILSVGLQLISYPLHLAAAVLANPRRVLVQARGVLAHLGKRSR